MLLPKFFFSKTNLYAHGLQVLKVKTFRKINFSANLERFLFLNRYHDFDLCKKNSDSSCINTPKNVFGNVKQRHHYTYAFSVKGVASIV